MGRKRTGREVARSCSRDLREMPTLPSGMGIGGGLCRERDRKAANEVHKFSKYCGERARRGK
jgi:hypothetical protein